MKIAYFDCLSGISGDMTLGALVDAGVPLALLNEAIQDVCGQVHLVTEKVIRKGFRALQVHVLPKQDCTEHAELPHCHHDPRDPHAPAHSHSREHEHRNLSTILAMIARSQLSAENQRQASEIFQLLAQAEAFVHGVEPDDVHFHEVGALDSIADIVGVVVGLDYLNVDEIQASPVPTGTGTIEIAHGHCSLPAPATAELLRGIPLAMSDVAFELTTPTGAAILKHYVKIFGPLPAMTIQTIGIGAGSRDLPTQPNVLRLLLGNMESGVKSLHAAIQLGHENVAGISANAIVGAGRPDGVKTPFPAPVAQERVWMLETNLDDITGELVGHCVERLWTLNPLDVWITPIQMKKHRPGVTLSILCGESERENLESCLFSETSTLGVRRWTVDRSVLQRETCLLETPWGVLDAKRAFLPDGTQRIAPEFDSLRRLAAEQGIAVRTILESLE